MPDASPIHASSLPSYSQVACIGAGASGIALGATLKRWYGLEDIQYFERQADCGGTWHINTYPGTRMIISQPASAVTILMVRRLCMRCA